jgi:hypothetical protein
MGLPLIPDTNYCSTFISITAETRAQSFQVGILCVSTSSLSSPNYSKHVRRDFFKNQVSFAFFPFFVCLSRVPFSLSVDPHDAELTEPPGASIPQSLTLYMLTSLLHFHSITIAPAPPAASHRRPLSMASFYAHGRVYHVHRARAVRSASGGGTERTSASERPRSRAVVDIFNFLRFFSSFLSPRARHNTQHCHHSAAVCSLFHPI